MASSAPNPNTTYHARSISLPSRPNTLIVNINEQARRLASSCEATTPSSPSLLSSRLSELRDLYHSVDALLALPHTRQLLSCESHRERVDGLLSSSLCFLDVCGIAKDVVLQRKEQAQDLQSVLRRKRGNKSEIIKESTKYLALGKMSKKAVSKSLRDLKIKCSNLSLAECEPSKEVAFGMLRQVEMVSATVFGSLLHSLSASKAQSKASSWSLILKLIVSSERVSCSEESTKSSEFKNVDSILQALIHGKMGKKVSFGEDDLQNELRRLESSIQDLEEELDSMLRCIIRTRASLLNILTN